MLAFVIKAADGQCIVLEGLLWVVDSVIGKLSYSVWWVHFVEDKLLVLLVFDLNSEREETRSLCEVQLEHLKTSFLEELHRKR